MEDRIRVSVVSYVNSYPFIYGLQHQAVGKLIDLQLDTPAECAKKLLNGQVDLGLVPVAIIPLLAESHIVSNKCIGADGAVETVCLYSEVPIHQVQKVFLDYQSRTSVKLVQLLAEQHWKIHPEWVDGSVDFIEQIGGTSAGVVIGDRTFGLEERFPFVYDLSAEWKKLTGLPFVFACWVSNRPLEPEFISQFEEALNFGLSNRKQALTSQAFNPSEMLVRYLNDVISYDLDHKKREALKLFLAWLSKSS